MRIFISIFFAFIVFTGCSGCNKTHDSSPPVKGGEGGNDPRPVPNPEPPVKNQGCGLKGVGEAQLKPFVASVHRLLGEYENRYLKGPNSMKGVCSYRDVKTIDLGGVIGSSAFVHLGEATTDKLLASGEMTRLALLFFDYDRCAPRFEVEATVAKIKNCDY